MKYKAKKKINKKDWDEAVKRSEERIKDVYDKAKVDNESLQRKFDY